MFLFNRHLMTTSVQGLGLPQGVGGKARLLQSLPGGVDSPRNTPPHS